MLVFLKVLFETKAQLYRKTQESDTNRFKGEQIKPALVRSLPGTRLNGQPETAAWHR